MPSLIAPIFNTKTEEPVSIPLSGPFQLVSGDKDLYEITAKYLRTEMNENRYFFDRKVKADSLFIYADYPNMRINEDRKTIESFEHKLNLATDDGVCSIPYVMTSLEQTHGITYLKRSLEGNPIVFSGRTRQIFELLLAKEGQFPDLAYSRYMLSLEKESWEDRLLDLCIALESLFVPDGKKGEIMYKLRLRIAYYFANTFADRQRVSEFIKQAYNHRSEIVHSGKMLGEALIDEVHLLRKIARAAIINQFLEGVSQQELRKRLDELVLSGESYFDRYQPHYFEQVIL